jgi:hypothetical protein
MSDNYVLLDIWNIRLYLDVYINICHQGTINMPPYTSDEISKTNPHRVILWFQQHVILYSQRNVIIQRWPLYSIYCKGSYVGLSTGLFTWKLLCWSSHNHFSTDWNQICVVYSLTYVEAPISNVSTFGVLAKKSTLINYGCVLSKVIHKLSKRSPLESPSRPLRLPKYWRSSIPFQHPRDQSWKHFASFLPAIASNEFDPSSAELDTLLP